jgi:hypothetical protein
MPPRTRPQLPQVGEDGLPTSVADWIQEAVSALDQLRWRVSEADYQMRNPNAIIDTLQRKYEKDVAPVLGERQKKRPRYPVYWKLASVPPGLVQKILNFLPLDKVHQAKQVSKLYRSAAHSAMTRGRWKPVRLFAEHLKRHAMPTSSPALCRAAWDVDPIETLRLALTRPGPAAAQFLALVEPSLDGLERILRACEPVCHFAMRRHKLDNQLAINRSAPFRVIAEWAKRIGTPITGQQGQPWVLPAERRALVLRGLSRALRTWTGAKVAVDYFLNWLQILGETPKLVGFTRNWETQLVRFTRNWETQLVEFTRNWEDIKAFAFVNAFAMAIDRATADARQRRKCCTECSRRGVKECRSRGPGLKCWTCKESNRRCSLVYVNDYPEEIVVMPSYRWP